MAAAAALAAATAGVALAAPPASYRPHHPAAAHPDASITVNTGGDRIGAGGPAGLGGVTFLAGGSSDGATGTCTTDAAGTCTISITTSATQSYTVTPTSVPAGWFSNPVLGVGAAPLAPGNTGTPYDTVTTPVIGPTGSATVPVPLNTSSLLSRGDRMAFSRTDRAEPTECGLRVALLFDLSTSIVSPANNLPQYLAAGRSFVTALEGTPSEIAVYTFGTDAPATSAPGTGNNATLPLTPVSTSAGADTVRNKISGLTVQGSQYTNWDAGLWQIAASGDHYDVVIVLTDGDPTRFGRPNATALPAGTGVVTRFIDVENGIFSSNELKATTGTAVPNPSVLAVGINVPSLGSQANLASISGPEAGVDYFPTDFADLGDTLRSLARDQCEGSITVVKHVIPHGGMLADATPGGPGWEFTSTAPAETRTTDATSAVSFRTTGTTPTTITETPMSGFTPLPGDTSCVDTVTGATVPIIREGNGFTITPDPLGIISCNVYNEAPPVIPAITITKHAFPTEYGAPGEQINYTFTVTNTGNVPLSDVSVVDSRLGEIECPLTDLAPGESMECQASYITTEQDVAAGFITNRVTVTGQGPAGQEVTDTDEETVTAIHTPGIEVRKSASPATFSAAEQTITYTYTVANVGNTILHGITLTDSRLGTITCPSTELAPGAEMTCTATYTTTKADVRAGRIVNFATATGKTPDGTSVTSPPAQAFVRLKVLPEVPVIG
ncbi:MAG TPA: vWA domain-containing protein [Trebonia sp.]|nr:vWA domain-containing protein [Trebonia sp.]